jgi:hypothetical protein
VEDEYLLKDRIRNELFSGLAAVLGDQAQSLKAPNIGTSGVEGGRVVKREAVTSHDLIESQLVSSIREIVKNNYQLATVLQNLDQACGAILVGGYRGCIGAASTSRCSVAECSAFERDVCV